MHGRPSGSSGYLAITVSQKWNPQKMWVLILYCNGLAEGFEFSERRSFVSFTYNCSEFRCNSMSVEYVIEILDLDLDLENYCNIGEIAYSVSRCHIYKKSNIVKK